MSKAIAGGPGFRRLLAGSLVAMLLALPGVAQNVTFHNTLGSLSETSNSLVGPPLVAQTTGDPFGGIPCSPAAARSIISTPIP